MKRKTTNFRSIGYCAILLVLIVIGCNKDDGPAEVSQTNSEQQADPEPQNRAPLANAGDNRQEEIGALVKLDGSLSSDPDGDAITFNWSFSDLPVGSTTTLIGVGKDIAEFTMDKAGDYKVLLEISDGAITSTDSVTVSNKTPMLEVLRSYIDIDFKSNDDEIEEGIAQRGQLMQLYGSDFSPVKNDNKVTLAGFDCEIEYVRLGEVASDLDRLTIIIPEDANPGEMVLTVGNHSTAWPTAIRLVESPPVQAWIENEPALLEKDRPSGTYRDIGTVFKPLVNGQLVALGVRSNRVNYSNDKPRITVWDMESETPLVSMDLDGSRAYMQYSVLENPIHLETGKEYGVTFASNDWFFYTTGSKAPFFPKTIGQIELVKHIQTGVFNDPLTDSVFPDEASLAYLTRGVDILFVPDTD
jgi:hypothetical protein